MNTVLQQLTAILTARKNAEDVGASYVASLHAQGIDKILKKIGEECAETLLAAKDVQYAGAQDVSPALCDTRKQALVYETADLWFHTLVMLSHYNLSADNVLQELARRLDLSGLTEKSSRTN